MTSINICIYSSYIAFSCPVHSDCIRRIPIYNGVSKEVNRHAGCDAKQPWAQAREAPGEGVERGLCPHRDTAWAVLRRAGAVRAGAAERGTLWVSNSLSGRRWQLNQVPAVRCPPYVVEVRTGYRVSARHGERRVAVQGRVAPCRVVVGLEVGEFPLQIPPIPEEHQVQKFSPYRADQALYKGV